MPKFELSILSYPQGARYNFQSTRTEGSWECFKVLMVSLSWECFCSFSVDALGRVIVTLAARFTKLVSTP